MTPITFTDEPTSSSADTNLAPTTPPMSAGPNPFFAPDRPDVAQTESPLSPPLAPAPSLVRPTVEVTVKEERGWLRRMFRWFVVKPYQFACLFVLLGVVSIVPLLQFAAFGYLLEVAGRTARTGRFRDSISKLSEASKLVTAGIAIYLVSLPAVLLGSWSNSAAWIVANNPSTPLLRFSAIAVSCLGMVYLLWAWARGGRIRDYLWPAPIRFLREGFRPSFWKAAYQRLWELFGRLEATRLFWLGLRGAIGTLVWIGIPATMLIGATRNGETGAAGLVGTLGILSMGFVLQYVPFLQAQLAADDRFRAMFEWRRARRSFRRAPLLFWIALTFTLLLAIPPYLLKIEEVPQEIAWLFAAMVIGFVLPGRILAGWAIAKSNQRDDPKGIIRFGWRWLLRSLNIPVIFFYLFIVWGTQFTSWHGLQTWVQQHAIFVPAPFAGG